MSTTIQKSLFPDKNDFVGETFMNTHLTDDFIKCIKQGVCAGFNIVTHMAEITPMSLSLRAHNMHEAVWNNVKTELGIMMPDANMRFHGAIAGNQRNFFEYNGIKFIFKKDIDSKNKLSHVTQIIDSQDADAHIVTIHYDVSLLWDAVLSVSFLYLKNGNIIFAHTISMFKSSVSSIVDKYNDVDDIKATAPKLKDKIANSI